MCCHGDQELERRLDRVASIKDGSSLGFEDFNHCVGMLNGLIFKSVQRLQGGVPHPLVAVSQIAREFGGVYLLDPCRYLADTVMSRCHGFPLHLNVLVRYTIRYEDDAKLD